MSLTTKISRRDFIKEVSAYAAVASAGLGPNMSFPRPVRIAVIGLGDTGMNCLETLNGVSDVKIVAICDRLGQSIQRALGMLGQDMTAYDDPAKLLSQENVDGIVLAVPQHVQDFLTGRLLTTNRTLYTERPIPVRNLSRPWFSTKLPVVFGRPVGIEESSRDALEAAVLHAEPVRQMDIRVWMCVSRSPQDSLVPEGAVAEAIAPCLPALAGRNLQVDLGSDSQARSAKEEPLILLNVLGQGATSVTQNLRMEINVRRDSTKPPCVASVCRYQGTGRAIELRSPAVNPRRQGLAMFVAQSSGAALSQNPKRVLEQQVALAFERAVAESMVEGRRLRFFAG